jgi:hypothetical protein
MITTSICGEHVKVFVTQRPEGGIRMTSQSSSTSRIIRFMVLLGPCLCTFSTGAQGLGYRLLRPGESAEYSFNVPYRGSFGDTAPTPAQGLFNFAPYDSGSMGVMRFELFENATTEAPLFVETWTPLFGGDSARILDAWQDRQGAVRFTGISDITGFSFFHVTVLTPIDAFHYDYYSQSFEAVPEPGVGTLVLLGLFTGVSMLFVRKKNTPPASCALKAPPMFPENRTSVELERAGIKHAFTFHAEP